MRIRGRKVRRAPRQNTKRNLDTVHILEQYALGTGVKIREPFMVTHFFPVHSDKYITIHNGKKFETRNYDLWRDVVAYIRPILNKEGISIVQVGGKEDGPIDGVEEYTMGRTTLKQTASVIRGAMLHVGIDSFPVHVASCFDVPVVGLYSNMHPSHSRPYWSSFGKAICLESHREGRKPSYSAHESVKSINMINPEDVANAVFKLLKIDASISEKTVYIGPSYASPILELVPNFPIEAVNCPQGGINVRMDYEHNEQILAHTLSKRKCNVLAKKPINLGLLSQFRQNVASITFEIDETFTEDYFDKVKRLGIPMSLGVYKRKVNSITDLRIQFFEYEIDEFTHSTKEDFKDEDITEGQEFKSNKFIMSNGKLYLSYMDWKNDNSTPSFNLNSSKVIDCPEFWREVEHFRITKNI